MAAVAVTGSTIGSLSGCGPTVSRPAAAAATPNAVLNARSVVSHWTNIALNQVRRRSITPPPATRAFAMGHLAGFLAVNGISGRYRSRHNIGNGPEGADLQTAYAAAFARAAGVALGVNFSGELSAFTTSVRRGDATSRAMDWGERVGSYVAGWRRQDGSGPASRTIDSFRYPKQRGPMAWVPTGNHHGARGTVPTRAGGGPLLPSWGKLRPFGISSARAFLPAPFPGSQSIEFARQFQKVKEIGRFENAARTADQTQIALFWEDGPGGVTPPGHWQIIALRVLDPMGLDLVTYAHHMALVSMAQADAAIVAWDSKYHFDIVRPETAIRDYGDRFGNAHISNARDPNWRSVIPTPPFPAYVSGHSTFAGASARMLALVIGTDSVRFGGPAADPNLWPSYLNGVTRSWSGLWHAAQECGDSREYGGVHWEHDNTQGLIAGYKIADSIYQSAFI